MKIHNRIKNLLVLLPVFFCFVLVLNSCGGMMKTAAKSEDNGEIPPDFHTFRDTLLVIKHPRDIGFDKSTKNEFEKSYSGPFLLINEKEIDHYPIDKYRYVFNSIIVTINGGLQGGSYYISQVTDRQTKKEYNTKNRIKFTSYVKALSEELHK